jgi:DNA polymerase-1
LIVDGTNLFVINYAVNTAVDDNGTPIGGAAGFLNALKKIILLLKPTRVVIVFDGDGGSLRKKAIYKDYKKGRSSRKRIIGKMFSFDDERLQKENLKYQKMILSEMLPSLPVNVVQMDNVEADDVIGYALTFMKASDVSNIIVTTDKDFYQLVDEKCVIYNPITKKLVTQKTILEKFSIHPNNWLFYKSINGDKSDSVDGIKGFGEKTICKLFDLKSETPISIDSITETSGSYEKRYKTLVEGKNIIERNFTIMNLKNPLMGLDTKDKLYKQLSQDKTSLNKVGFELSSIKYGVANYIYTSYTFAFVGLIRGRR